MKRVDGRRVTQERARWAPLIASRLVSCPKCRQVIEPTDAWDLGHRDPIALGGPVALSNTVPEHASCNRSEGGRLRAASRRARRTRLQDWLR